MNSDNWVTTLNLSCPPTTTGLVSLTMQTRSTILGKRGHQDSSSVLPAHSFCEQLETPDNTPNPKRAQTTTVVLDGDSNKENIPPFNNSQINIDISPRAVRALQQHATESVVAPTRSRARMYILLFLKQALSHRLISVRRIEKKEIEQKCCPVYVTKIVVVIPVDAKKVLRKGLIDGVMC